MTQQINANDKSSAVSAITIAGSSLELETTYLCLAIATMYSENTAAASIGADVALGGSTVANSEANMRSRQAANYNRQYQWVGEITTGLSEEDVTLRLWTEDGIYPAYARNCVLVLIKVEDLTSGEYASNSSTGATNSTTYTARATCTLNHHASQSRTWLILGASTANGTSVTESYLARLAGVDDAQNFAIQAQPHHADEICHYLHAAVTTTAGDGGTTDIELEIATTAGATPQYIYAFVCAINLDDVFASYHATEASSASSPLTTSFATAVSGSSVDPTVDDSAALVIGACVVDIGAADRQANFRLQKDDSADVPTDWYETDYLLYSADTDDILPGVVIAPGQSVSNGVNVDFDLDVKPSTSAMSFEIVDRVIVYLFGDGSPVTPPSGTGTIPILSDGSTSVHDIKSGGQL